MVKKPITRGYIYNLEGLHDELVKMVPDNGNEITIVWYEEQLERVEEAKLQANAHLDDQVEQNSSASHEKGLRQELSSKQPQFEQKQLALEEQRRSSKKTTEINKKLIIAKQKQCGLVRVV